MPHETPTNPGEGEEVSLHSHRTVSADFEHRESLGAQSQKKARRRVLEQVAGATGYGEYFDQAQILREIGLKNAAKQTIKNVAQRLILARLSPWLYGITLAICSIQFLFSLISLIGFALQGLWLYTSSETLVGRVVGWALDAVSFIYDLGNLMPLEYLGMTFYALAAIVGMGGFIGFMIFFYLLGVDMMRSTISTLVLAVCLSFTILPVSNLVPWLFVWVFYVVRSESSFFNMALEHHKTSRDTERARSAANDGEFGLRQRA